MNRRRALIALLSLILLAACQRTLFSPETAEQRFARPESGSGNARTGSSAR